MLKQRLLTALLLIPLVVGAVLLLPPSAFVLGLGILTALAAWEWPGFAGIRSGPQRLLYTVFVLLCGFVFLSQSAWSRPLILLACGLWAAALAVIVAVQYRRAVPTPIPALVLLSGLFVLVPPWLSLAWLREVMGAGMVLFLLVLIWVADSAAYFCGKRWGRRRLASHISPGKSWEGVWGALLGCFLAGFAYTASENMQGFVTIGFLMVCIITVVASITGDLLESMMKRAADLKDSGTILPGHGGMLDRIDSLTAAAPVFAAGLLLLGYTP